jgi:hypothetical protein
VSRVFLLQFFYESSSPKPLKITFRSFQIFLKIHGDIRKSRCSTSINDAGGKLTTGTAGVVDADGKFAKKIIYFDMLTLLQKGFKQNIQHFSY